MQMGLHDGPEGEVGELEFENFNAAAAKIEVKGLNVHPGYAKGKMVNALLVANEFIGMLPANENSGYDRRIRRLFPSDWDGRRCRTCYAFE